MFFLIRDISWILAIVAVLWFAIGWKLREGRHRSFVHAMDQEHEHKMLALRRSRDDFRDQLEQVAATNGDGKLTQDQRSQIATHIRKLENEVNAGREQIATLGTKLNAIGTTSNQRDEEYRRLQARLDEATSTLGKREGAAAAASMAPQAAAQVAEHEQTIKRLNTRIEALSRQQTQPLATEDHARLLGVIRAQKTTIAKLTRRVEEPSPAPSSAPPGR